MSSGKILSCFFDDNVLCSFRKSEKFGMMNRCQTCNHFERFMREADEENQRFDDGVEEIHKLQARFERGELSLEEYRKRYFELDRELE